MHQIHLRIRNLSDEEYSQLKFLALQQTGSSSVSTLVRHWIRDVLQTPSNNVLLTQSTSSRIEIRLKNKEKLLELATSQNMGLNRFISMLLYNYTHNKKMMSTSQIQVLRDSNYQLYQIGKNINQIAKALNHRNAVSLTSQKLDFITKVIETHTNKVADLISTTPTL